MTDLPGRPSPEKAAEQLCIFRYIVTAANQETHARLMEGAPWAHWVEPRPVLAPLVAWLVTVFAIDNDAFLTMLAREEDKILIEVLGNQSGDTDPPATQFWSPWVPPGFTLAPGATNGHG